jgi:preprotein translocase subunit YajC
MNNRKIINKLINNGVNMSFRQKMKENLKPGSQVTLIKGGLEYVGKVISIDFMNPADSNVVIINEDKQLITMSLGQDVVIINDAASKEADKDDDETEDEIEQPVKNKTVKKRK